MIDKILCGDSLELLKKMQDETVDLIITSPPYFNLRDYGNEGQIGHEPDVNSYIDNLQSIFREAHRVLKKSGSLWINIDDTYSQKNDFVQRGSLMCIPDRLKIRLVSDGWILRNEIIWRKPNAMPSSAKNRFNGDYEKFYFFVKTNDYRFNTQYEPMKSKKMIKKAVTHHNESKYESIEQESSVRQGMNKARGNKIIALRKNLPTQERFVNFIRERSDVDLISDNSDIKKTTIEHWFRKDKCGFCFPSQEDWNSIKWLLNDWSDEFIEIDKMLNDITYETDDILKNSDKGRIKRAVWDINTKAFKGCHFATFPEELVITPIMACTNEGDIVLDVFAGSATTCVVAKKLKRHYVGFDINEDYCEIARKRLMEVNND
jgi:DNA modification methylase